MYRPLHLAACLIAVTWLLGSGGPVAAAPVPWSNSSGTANFFDWSDGQNENDLFGSPTVEEGVRPEDGQRFASFVFSPPNFEAASNGDGSTDTVWDRLEVTLQAHPGQKFTRIEVYEVLDYQITKVGSIAMNSQAVTDDQSASRSRTEDIDVTASATGGKLIGGWDGMYFIDFIGDVPDWNYLKLKVTNTLTASSTGSKSSSSVKKHQSQGVVVVVLPEPGMLWLLGLGGLVGLRRRRG